MQSNLTLILTLTILWTLGIPNTGLAQTVESSPQIISTQVPENPTTEPNVDTEVEVLRAQLETMQFYDQRLLETVYWSLGITGGILLVLVSYGFYSSLILSKREKENIANELEGELQKQLTEERASITKQIAAEHATNVKQIEDLKAELRNLIAGQLKQAVAATEAKIAEIQERFTDVTYDINMVEAEMWISKGVFSNALRCQINMLSLSLEGSKQVLLGLVLDRIEEVLQLAHDKGGMDMIGSQDRAALVQQLNRVPQEFDTTINAIRQKLE